MTTNKKYEFTGKTMQFEGRTLKRIRYVREMSYAITSGKIGGWIEHEGNLSHEGRCCVIDDSKVFGHASIMENAVVSDDAIVKDNAQIKGDAYVSGDAVVGADTIVEDYAWIVNQSEVYFYDHMLEGKNRKANLSGNTRILGNSLIEATGHISNKIIKNKELFGFLK